MSWSPPTRSPLRNRNAASIRQGKVRVKLGAEPVNETYSQWLVAFLYCSANSILASRICSTSSAPTERCSWRGRPSPPRASAMKLMPELAASKARDNRWLSLDPSVRPAIMLRDASGRLQRFQIQFHSLCLATSSASANSAPHSAAAQAVMGQCIDQPN